MLLFSLTILCFAATALASDYAPSVLVKTGDVDCGSLKCPDCDNGRGKHDVRCCKDSEYHSIELESSVEALFNIFNPATITRDRAVIMIANNSGGFPIPLQFWPGFARPRVIASRQGKEVMISVQGLNFQVVFGGENTEGMALLMFFQKTPINELLPTDGLSRENWPTNIGLQFNYSSGQRDGLAFSVCCRDDFPGARGAVQGILTPEANRGYWPNDDIAVIHPTVNYPLDFQPLDDPIGPNPQVAAATTARNEAVMRSMGIPVNGVRELM